MHVFIRKTGQYSRFKDAVQAVERTVRQTASGAGLDDWDFRLAFKNLARKDGVFATSHIEWAYRSAVLTFDLAYIYERGGNSWRFLEETVRHEVLHIPVWRLVEFAQTVIPKDSPFRALLEAHEEELVETLARMPVWHAFGLCGGVREAARRPKGQPITIPGVSPQYD